MTAIITLPRWLSGPANKYVTRSGGAYTPDDVALRFALALRIHDTADSIRAVAFNLVGKVCLEHQPTMKRLARSEDDAEVIAAAIRVINRCCDLLGYEPGKPFLRNEVRRSKRYIEFTTEQLQALGESYAAGSSLRQLSASYGISESVVSRRLKAMGVAVRPTGRSWAITDELMDRGQALKDSGMTWVQVGKEVGVGWESLTAAMRRRRARRAKADE